MVQIDLHRNFNTYFNYLFINYFKNKEYNKIDLFFISILFTLIISLKAFLFFIFVIYYSTFLFFI